MKLQKTKLVCEQWFKILKSRVEFGWKIEMIEIEMNISATFSATLTEQNSEKTSIEHVGYGHKITLFFSMCQYPC